MTIIHLLINSLKICNPEIQGKQKHLASLLVSIWMKTVPNFIFQRHPENYKKLQRAFYAFHVHVFDMIEENFLHHRDWDVFKFG